MFGKSPRCAINASTHEKFNTITCESTRGATHTLTNPPEQARRILSAFQQNPRNITLKAQKGSEKSPHAISRHTLNGESTPQSRQTVSTQSSGAAHGSSSLDIWTTNTIQSNSLTHEAKPEYPCLAMKIVNYPFGGQDIITYPVNNKPRLKHDKERKEKKNRSEMSQEDLARSIHRSRQNFKQKSYMLCPTHLLTTTYKENQTSLKRGWQHWTKFIVLYKQYYGKELAYTVVPERQKRGAIHFHALIVGYHKATIIRYLWQKAIKGKGNIDLQQIKGKGKGVASATRYAMKYLNKTMDSINPDYAEDLNTRRYSCSKGIAKPEMKTIYVDYGDDSYRQVYKIVRTLGKIRTARRIEKPEWHLLYFETY